MSGYWRHFERLSKSRPRGSRKTEKSNSVEPRANDGRVRARESAEPDDDGMAERIRASGWGAMRESGLALARSLVAGGADVHAAVDRVNLAAIASTPRGAPLLLGGPGDIASLACEPDPRRIPLRGRRYDSCLRKHTRRISDGMADLRRLDLLERSGDSPVAVAALRHAARLEICGWFIFFGRSLVLDGWDATRVATALNIETHRIIAGIAGPGSAERWMRWLSVQAADLGA